MSVQEQMNYKFSHIYDLHTHFSASTSIHSSSEAYYSRQPDSSPSASCRSFHYSCIVKSRSSGHGAATLRYLYLWLICMFQWSFELGWWDASCSLLDPWGWNGVRWLQWNRDFRHCFDWTFCWYMHSALFTTLCLDFQSLYINTCFVLLLLTSVSLIA